jgi:D-threo-aldose 1-dehydrogenase
VRTLHSREGGRQMSVDLTSRRRLGTTTLSLPPFGQGTGPLGNLFETLSEATAHGALEAAWSAGVRYYDTAPWYGRGLSELRLGAFLRSKPRNAFLLTTKVGRTLRRPKNPETFDRSPWVGGLSFDVVFDYSYDGIMRSYEQALQRLGLPTVDGLAVHDLDRGFHGDAFAGHARALLDSGVKALAELRRSGDVRAVGMGFNLSEALDAFIDKIDLDYALVAHPYTLLEQPSLKGGMARCISRNVSVIVGAPFASGILATGPGPRATFAYSVAPPEIQEKVAAIEAVSAAHKVRLPAAALQFPLAHPAVISVIAGAVRASEASANAAHVQEPIPAAFWSDLKMKGLIDPEAPTPG